jgi:hypothetical protein
MLNPIKTPTQMMYEQAGIPHYGKGGDVIGQFAGRIQDAIRKYTKAVGKPPTPEEVKQLEDHIRSLSKPTGNAPQTLARTQQQTPFSNQLVDASGRPYPAVTTPEGRTITPERAKGMTTRETIGPFQGVPSQFDMTPMNIKARAYPKGQFQNAFPEDEFMSMANTGRTSNRTWNKSFTPSTEELATRQQLGEEALTGVGDDAMGGLDALRMTEGDIPQMTSASAPFAERAAQLEGPGIEKLTDEMLLGKHGALVDKVVADFKARGIEPDKEDVVNAINAMINPMRHNYTGTNPIAQRPMQGRGPATAEMNAWRDEARMSGLPETVVTKHPSDWKPQQQRDYLLDTEPAQRAPFAQDWQMQELEDKRRRAMQGKAEGGYMQSPRDMQAEMMVRGYAGGGQTQGPTQEDILNYIRSGGSRMGTSAEEVLMRNMEKKAFEDQKLKSWSPSPRERISGLGSEFLSKYMTKPTARKVAANFAGGADSDLPFGFGVIDAAGFVPALAPAMAPFYGSEGGFNAGRDLAQDNYGSAALNTVMAFPPSTLIGKTIQGGKKVYGMGKEALRNSTTAKYLPGAGFAGYSSVAEPDQQRYESVLQRPEYNRGFNQ